MFYDFVHEICITQSNMPHYWDKRLVIKFMVHLIYGNFLFQIINKINVDFSIKSF